VRWPLDLPNSLHTVQAVLLPAGPEEECLSEVTAGLSELLVYRARAGGQQLPPPGAVGEEGGGRLARRHEQMRQRGVH
jgi:hypothetical protein